MILHRRSFVTLAAAMTLVGQALAQDTQPPVVAAPKILEALNPKDVVIDRPGAAPGTSRPRRDPAISLQVQFTFDSAELMPQGKRQLDQLAMALNDKALAVSGFELAGHTDRVGDADYNIRLSLGRANAVRAYLGEVHGVALERLQTIGYGYARLQDPSRPTAAVNRRVEVRRVSGMRPAPGTNPPPRSVPAPAAGRLVPTPQ